MSPIMYERLWEAFLDTLLMVGASGLIALVAGIPLAVLLVLTSPGGVLEAPRFNRIAGGIVNAFRATPFIVLLVALIPLTRLITGTTIGIWAAVVPLSISATPSSGKVCAMPAASVPRDSSFWTWRSSASSRWRAVSKSPFPASTSRSFCRRAGRRCRRPRAAEG